MRTFLALCLAALSSTFQEDAAVQEAVKLVNQGNVEKGTELLRNHLAKNEKDVQARVIFGQILDFDGQPDEAVTAWEKGLGGEPSDVPLLMSIGEIRHRQGRDGPNISYRRGMMGVHPSKDKDAEDRFKTQRLAQAAAAYEKADKFHPGDHEIASNLASVYFDQANYDASIKIWKLLIQREPRVADHYLKLAMAINGAGRPKEAAEPLNQALALDPHLATAHETLAEIQEKLGLATEAKLSHKRAEFYGQLPPFCTLDYSEVNQKTLNGLDQEDAVRRLINDPTEEAAQLLAMLCWSHPHNYLETEAFRTLEARGPKTTPLLQALLKDARSTCTIRSTAHILARRKAEGIFDFLTAKLPGDLGVFGMDMDVAGSLDDLGDPRAVGPLVLLLNLADPDAGANDTLLFDRKSAQARATLALGAFTTPEAKAALNAALRVPRLKPYALAALYRQTRSAENLAAVEKSVGPEDSFMSYIIDNYLIKKVGTKEAKALSDKWRKEHEAAEKASKKQDTEAK